MLYHFSYSHMLIFSYFPFMILIFISFISFSIFLFVIMFTINTQSGELECTLGKIEWINGKSENMFMNLLSLTHQWYDKCKKTKKHKIPLSCFLIRSHVIWLWLTYVEDLTWKQTLMHFWFSLLSPSLPFVSKHANLPKWGPLKTCLLPHWYSFDLVGDNFGIFGQFASLFLYSYLYKDSSLFGIFSCTLL